MGTVPEIHCIITYYYCHFLRERSLTKTLGEDKLRIKNSLLNLEIVTTEWCDRDGLVHVRKLPERWSQTHTHLRKDNSKNYQQVQRSWGSNELDFCEEQRGNQCDRKKGRQTAVVRLCKTLQDTVKGLDLTLRMTVRLETDLSRDVTCFQDRNYK